MRDGTHQIRSIATELALLFLSELEPRVADDPALLVSTEALLAFGAIRRTDPVQWENWQAILEKYEKSQLVEYMLREPARSEDSVWMSKADRLIGLALDAGLNLFPTSRDGLRSAWAATARTIQFARATSGFFFYVTIMKIPARAREVKRYAPHWSCSRRERFLTEKSVPSMCAWRSVGGGSTWICAIALGGPSKSIPRVGGL